MAQVINFLTISSTLVLNGTAILDFIEGDYMSLTFPNPTTSRAGGDNNNVTVSGRVDALVCMLAVTVKKMSAADKFLNKQRFTDTPTIFQGSVKDNYSANGAEFVESFLLENGSLTEQTEDSRNNQERTDGVTYTIEFRRGVRQL